MRKAISFVNLPRKTASSGCWKPRAAVAQAEIDYRGALKLKEKGYQTDSAIAQANARLESTRAALRLTEIHLANTRIAAPFAGFVDDRPVEVGDQMDCNHICAEIVEMNPLKVVSSFGTGSSSCGYRW